MDYFDNSFSLLTNVSFYIVFFMMFGFIFTDFPRYILCFLALLLTKNKIGYQKQTNIIQLFNKVSIIVVGYNEGANIRKCIKAICEQSLPNMEIIVVSDGSTDNMAKEAQKLLSEGLIDKLIVNEIRGGKSSGLNVACRYAKGDIIINIDCDCSLDKKAFRELLLPFSNPEVGAVCSDLKPRNSEASLITAYQSIEYLISISFGKESLQMLDQVSCASGALSAFRREAILCVGGFDVGGGEDLDFTIRLRRHGWKIVFANNSLCYTDVPENLNSFIKQRMRWERDTARLRLYKYWYQFLPFHSSFNTKELISSVRLFLS